MAFDSYSISDFTAALAAKTSTPGGGGASALTAALGCALGAMTANFTIGKKKYASVEDEIKSLLDEADALQKELITLIDRDAEAFEPLSKAYGIPKDDPHRDEIMEKCLRDACAVPLDIMKFACRAIDLNAEFAAKGSRLMISDAGTGAALCRAALQGAYLNVRVNTKLMKDEGYRAEINEQADTMLNQYGEKAAKVFQDVMETM